MSLLLRLLRLARRHYWTGALSVGILGIGAELALRLAGFGDPPLEVLDPKIEYYSKPGKYRRFGRDIIVNAEGMRGDEVRPAKPEHRILLLGDSIVRGTNRLGQHELISSALAERLGGVWGATHVEVLNAACGSWGPVNQLAYLERFGTFSADRVVWVLSSHDLTDVPLPGYASLLPVQKPLLALGDVLNALRRYSWKQPATDPRAAETTLAAVGAILDLLQRSNTPVTVVQHWSVQELAQGAPESALRLKQYFDQRGVEVLQLDRVLGDAMRAGTPYEDDLHVSPLGARAVGAFLADRLLDKRDLRR